MLIKKTISYSYNYLNNPIEIIEKTIRHEIAHAIDNIKRGYSNHDRNFKYIAMLCGVSGKCKSEEKLNNLVEYKYTGTCPNCGKKIGYSRKLKNSKACGICCDKYNHGKYTERFKLVFTVNY